MYHPQQPGYQPNSGQQYARPAQPQYVGPMQQQYVGPQYAWSQQQYTGQQYAYPAQQPYGQYAAPPQQQYVGPQYAWQPQPYAGQNFRSPQQPQGGFRPAGVPADVRAPDPDPLSKYLARVMSIKIKDISTLNDHVEKIRGERSENWTIYIFFENQEAAKAFADQCNRYGNVGMTYDKTQVISGREQITKLATAIQTIERNYGKSSNFKDVLLEMVSRREQHTNTPSAAVDESLPSYDQALGIAPVQANARQEHAIAPTVQAPARQARAIAPPPAPVRPQQRCRQ